ncbi:MAG: hypothetical protein L0H70_03430 [Xanthomonadales bacterium]|nr:hypothetical protein [Xanthomonadales bacterium]
MICPACRHHLRYGEAAKHAAENALPAFQVEGSLRRPGGDAAWEYSMVLTIRNQRGEEITRRLIGVGAIAPGEARSFSLSVEMTPTTDTKRTRH